MRNDWREVRICEIGTVVTGRTPPGTKDEYFGGEIPFLTPTDMDGRRRVGITQRTLSHEGQKVLSKVIVPHGVSVSCIGWQMGKAVLIDKPVATNQQVNTIIPDRSIIDDMFLYYSLTARSSEIFNLGAGGSRTPILNKSGFESFRIQIPALSFQKRIADILGTLDDKIELNRQTNETLEAMARRLFRSWFVDFDPVHAKAAARREFPGLDNAELSRRALPNMAPEIAELFPETFQDSPLGPIPKGWKSGTLAECASLNPDTWNRKNYPPVIHYVDLSSTKWGVIQKVETFSSANAPSRAQRKLRIGDTIIGTVRPGNGSFALVDQENLTGSTGFAVLRPNAVEHSEFIYLSATVNENIDRLAHLADGGAYPAIRPEVVCETEVVIADPKLMVAFHQKVCDLFSQMSTNTCLSTELAKSRDELLPRLLSDEVWTKDLMEELCHPGT